MALNILLVHGAWGDGSNWSRVIPLLLSQGFHVTAVQNPLTSLADDVANTRRILGLQRGPTLLVGHSYGGAVITEAGNDSPLVTGLVYIAAFAPDAGEGLGDLLGRGQPPPGGANIYPDPDGFLWIKQEGFRESFAQDLGEMDARVLGVAQRPIAGRCFSDKVTRPAWKVKPSWYQVSEQDRMIPPDTERFMAQRMRATTRSLPASHASLVSQPAEVSKLILEAAASVEAGAGASVH
ncbi:alpha/beta fold hydrolase [Myxococcus landrumensis]|uniref:Alpha/beta hydrolase n=1 Tax=Myxococcus landrumensis TaxID=2813577 RepID=A0ABX7NFQ6_9BACT|nr:alpha/beta hydrolase [Myxococcus landrumus]QSQ17640.1 alpha/beta hydrolase [Myxococcus landrumus]